MLGLSFWFNKFSFFSGFPNNFLKMVKNTRNKKPPAKIEPPNASSPKKSTEKEPEMEKVQNQI